MYINNMELGIMAKGIDSHLSLPYENNISIQYAALGSIYAPFYRVFLFPLLISSFSSQ